MSIFIKNSFLEYSDHFFKNCITKNTNDNNIEEDINFLNISKIVDLLSERNSKFINNDKEIEKLILNKNIKSKFSEKNDDDEMKISKKKKSNVKKYEMVNVINSKIIKKFKSKKKESNKKKKTILIKNDVNNINIDFIEKINIYKYPKKAVFKKKIVLAKSRKKNKNVKNIFLKTKINTNCTPKNNFIKIKKLRNKNRMKKKKISCDLDFFRYSKNKKIEKNIYQKFLKPNVSVKIFKNKNPTLTPKFEKNKKLKKNFSSNILKYKKNLKTDKKKEKMFFKKKFHKKALKRNSSHKKRFMINNDYNSNSESKKKFLNSLLKNLVN